MNQLAIESVLREKVISFRLLVIQPIWGGTKLCQYVFLHFLLWLSKLKLLLGKEKKKKEKKKKPYIQNKIQKIIQCPPQIFVSLNELAISLKLYWDCFVCPIAVSGINQSGFTSCNVWKLFSRPLPILSQALIITQQQGPLILKHHSDISAHCSDQGSSFAVR